ncbi:hypothetical protein WJX73_008905 [Symbiochloris irregularis]|uniref:Dynein heavy chain linker domain-containing protein n=1 Tax=Symbiochloris irregularis TaxID=706552 RepID=A0AAW1PGD9_9CHLO
MLASESSQEAPAGSFAESFKHTKGELFAIENLLDETDLLHSWKREARPKSNRKKDSQRIPSHGSSRKPCASEDTAVSQREAALDTMRAGVHTFDDILEVFAKGQACQLSVFFCRSPADALDFQPYDLKVYPPDHPVPPREADYYTVTMTGVVHVCCGQPTELTPLATFVRQRTLFRVLRSIPFYKHFIVRRALQRWHKNTRQALFKRLRAKVGQILLPVQPPFRAALQEVRGHVEAIASVPVLSLAPPEGGGGPWELAPFMQLQSSLREAELQKGLDNLAADIQQVAEQVVCEVGERLIKLGEQKQRRKANRHEDLCRSLAMVKHERLEHARQNELALSDSASLERVLRLIDYWMADALAALTISATKTLVAAMHPENNSAFTGLLMTSAAFQPEGRALLPCHSQVDKALNVDLLDAALEVAHSLPRPLCMRSFTPQLHGRPSSLYLRELLWDSKEYKAARKRINGILAEDFAAAEAAAAIYEPLHKIHSFGTTWSFELWSRDPRGVADMRGQLEELQAWAVEVEHMRMGTTLGCLQLEGHTLKADLHPIINTAQTQVKGLVLSQARQTAARCLNDMTALSAALNDRSPSLAAFCACLALSEEQAGIKQEMLQEVTDADDMFELLLQHGDRLSLADQVLRDDLTNAAEQYVTALRGAEQHVAASRKLQEYAWRSEAMALQRKCSTLVSELEGSSALHDPHTGTISVMDKLDEASTRLSTLQTEIEEHEHLREMLHLPPLPLGDVGKASAVLDMLHILWGAIKVLDDHIPEWTSAPLMDPTTGHVALDGACIQKEIFSLLGLVKINTTRYRMQQYTLEDLQAAGLARHLQAVQGIAHAAEQELAIEDALADMQQLWGFGRVAVYRPDNSRITSSGQRALHLGDNAHIQALLSSQTEQLQAILISPHLEPVKPQVLAWQRSLRDVGHMLESLAATQADYDAMQESIALPGRTIKPDAQRTQVQVEDKWMAVLKQAGRASSALVLASTIEWGQVLDHTAACILLERAKLPNPSP